MKQRVYIETSVISYLTGRPSRDMVVAAHQEITRQWWESRAATFELLVSELVAQEAAQGDAEAASKRISAMEGLSFLALGDPAVVLAEQLVDAGPIPSDSAADALHIALATVICTPEELMEELP